MLISIRGPLFLYSLCQGYFCASNVGSTTKCPAGKYSLSTASSCSTCSAGKYSLSMASACTSCSIGNYQPNTGQGSCLTCPSGKYQDQTGYTSCFSCGTGTFEPTVTGVTAVDECVCAESWTGLNCDQYECASTLDFASLGLLLIEASYPEELRQSGTLAERTVSQWTTYYRVNSILRTADANGDGLLSVDEASAALGIANVDVPLSVLSNEIVWTSSNGLSLSEHTSWTKQRSSSSITLMVAEAVAHFVDSGTFYGYLGESTATTSLFSLDATYPDSEWTESQCVSKIDSDVTLSWSFTVGSAALYQQCGYVNGAKLDEASFDDRMVSAADCSVSGGTTSCTFDDPDDIATSNRKRFYCVSMSFCASGESTCTSTSTDTSLARMQCKLGLLYDGTRRT